MTDILESAMSASELLARLEVKEFVFILPNAREKLAIQIAKRLCGLFENIAHNAMLKAVTARVGTRNLARENPYRKVTNMKT